MKILIVTQYFPPEIGAPQARLFELAVRLVGMGHEVTVLAAMPNYPTGRVFDGYRWKPRTTERIDGVKVVRTALYPSISSRMIPRMVSYISFALSAVLFGAWGLGRQDVSIVESPPLFLAPSGWLISKLKKARFVLMVSDIWPDILLRMGYRASSPGVRLMLKLEGWAYRRSDAVALTNPGAMKQISDRFPEVRTTVISNGVDTNFFSPARSNEQSRSELGAGPTTFLVGYCGLHGLAQGLDSVIDAAEILKGWPNIRVVMIGDGPVKQDLKVRAKKLGLENLHFLERRAKSEMPSIVASCDAILVPLGARMPGTMPSKVYEALAAGTPPIVARGCEGAILIETFNCGLTFDPMDAEGLAEAIIRLFEDPELLSGMRKRAVALAQRFDRDVIAERTTCVLEAIAAGRPLPEVTW